MATAPNRSKKWRSLWMSSWAAISGWVSMSSYHQVVPAFWAPMPTKDGGPTSSPGPGAGEVKSKPTSHGAYRPRPCSTPRRSRGGSRASPSRRWSRRLMASGPGARSRLPQACRVHNYRRPPARAGVGRRCGPPVPTVLLDTTRGTADDHQMVERGGGGGARRPLVDPEPSRNRG